MRVDAAAEADPGVRTGAPDPFAILLAVLLVVAAGVHGTLLPEHAHESVALGVGFAVSGALQLAAAILVLLRPSRRLMLTIAAGSAAAVAAWALSRVAGMPFGPDAWEPEPVGIVDAVTVLFEIAAVGAAALIASGRERDGRGVSAACWTCGAVGIALLSSAASHTSGGRAGGDGAEHLAGHGIHAALIVAAVLLLPLVHRAVTRRTLGPAGRYAAGSAEGTDPGVPLDRSSEAGQAPSVSASVSSAPVPAQNGGGSLAGKDSSEARSTSSS